MRRIPGEVAVPQRRVFRCGLRIAPTVDARTMAQLDQYALLDLIADAARVAQPEAPESVSVRAFDSVTASEERFAALPRARSLSRIFLQSWRDLVALSLMERSARARTLAHRSDAQEAGWFTHEQAEFALRLVCRRLGGVADFNPGDYRREREALAEGGRASAAMPWSLPTENQIVALFGSWEEALTAAELQAEPQAALPNTPADTGAAGRTRNAIPSAPTPTIIEVLDRCYEAHGTQPTFGELALFARANGIPFPRKDVGRPWDDYLDEWKRNRRAQGLQAPERPPAKRDRPDYGQDVGAARPGERRLTGWTDELIVEWVGRFLDQLPRDRRPTERAYADWTAGMPGAPGQSTLQRYGGFAHFMDQARRSLTQSADVLVKRENWPAGMAPSPCSAGV
jgi:hypothetical protein